MRSLHPQFFLGVSVVSASTAAAVSNDIQRPHRLFREGVLRKSALNSEENYELGAMKVPSNGVSNDAVLPDGTGTTDMLNHKERNHAGDDGSADGEVSSDGSVEAVIETTNDENTQGWFELNRQESGDDLLSLPIEHEVEVGTEIIEIGTDITEEVDDSGIDPDCVEVEVMVAAPSFNRRKNLIRRHLESKAHKASKEQTKHTPHPNHLAKSGKVVTPLNTLPNAQINPPVSESKTTDAATSPIVYQPKGDKGIQVTQSTPEAKSGKISKVSKAGKGCKSGKSCKMVVKCMSPPSKAPSPATITAPPTPDSLTTTSPVVEVIGTPFPVIGTALPTTASPAVVLLPTPPPIVGTLPPGTPPPATGTSPPTTAPPAGVLLPTPPPIVGTLPPGTPPPAIGTSPPTTAPPAGVPLPTLPPIVGTLPPGTPPPALGTSPPTTAPPAGVPLPTPPPIVGTLPPGTPPPAIGTSPPTTAPPAGVPLPTLPPIVGTLPPGTPPPAIGTSPPTTAPPAGVLLPTLPPIVGTLPPGTPPPAIGTSPPTTAPPAGVGTSSPVVATPTTTAPTLVPDQALYYRSFEQLDFPFILEEEDPVITTENAADSTLVWALTEEKANLGVKSVMSPKLENEGGIAGTANLMINLPDYGGPGDLYFSLFAGTQMPIDSLEINVNGEIKEVIFEAMTAFEQRVVNLGPGPNVVQFAYKYNPTGIPVENFPPSDVFPNRIGKAFIDDVYYVPAAIVVRSAVLPATALAPSVPCVPLEPNPDSFEINGFPLLPWSTTGDDVWALTTKKASDGTSSMRSPILDGSMAAAVSNATLQVCNDFPGGVLKLQVYASVQPPRDIFEIYIDGESAAQLVDVNEWTLLELGLESGPHRIDFSYQYNMFNYEVGLLPPSSQEREGGVWIDSVAIVPT